MCPPRGMTCTDMILYHFQYSAVTERARERCLSAAPMSMCVHAAAVIIVSESERGFKKSLRIPTLQFSCAAPRTIDATAVAAVKRVRLQRWHAFGMACCSPEQAAGWHAHVCVATSWHRHGRTLPCMETGTAAEGGQDDLFHTYGSMEVLHPHHTATRGCPPTPM